MKLTSWPKTDDGTSRYLITCSCGRWEFTGTLIEINREAMRHDDSPWHQHVVMIRGQVDDPPSTAVSPESPDLETVIPNVPSDVDNSENRAATMNGPS